MSPDVKEEIFIGEAKETKSSASHPYDDAFKTLRTDCPELFIPLINEVFHESYYKYATIQSLANEFYMSRADGTSDLIVSDSYIGICGKKYHVECQSTVDGTMIVRMFEYDSQIAIDSGEIKKDRYVVRFPHSAVLYLRTNSQTPDKFTVEIETAGGNVSYDINIIKIKNYTIEEIFDKELYMLIPFYIFTFEASFETIDTDKEKVEMIKNEYMKVMLQLNQVCNLGKITELEKCTIAEMTEKVLNSIARNYSNIKKGVGSVMGGKVLEYKAKTILNQGRQEGRQEGIQALILDNLEDGFSKERILEKLQKRFAITYDEAVRFYEMYGVNH